MFQTSRETHHCFDLHKRMQLSLDSDITWSSFKSHMGYGYLTEACCGFVGAVLLMKDKCSVRETQQQLWWLRSLMKQWKWQMVDYYYKSLRNSCHTSINFCSQLVTMTHHTWKMPLTNWTMFPEHKTQVLWCTLGHPYMPTCYSGWARNFWFNFVWHHWISSWDRKSVV